MVVDGRGGAEVRYESLVKIVNRGESQGVMVCKLAHRVGVKSGSRRCVQVLVSVRIRCSGSMDVYVSRREDQVQI